MDESTDTPLPELVESGPLERVRAATARLADAPAEERRDALSAVQAFAETEPAAFDGPLAAFTRFLTAEERSVRLTTAKLFVAVARADPDAVVPVTDALAARLGDESEFYFVRARAAEALGYVARTRPDSVLTPSTLADLRLGLEFDEPEVREKLAKALEGVALGAPERLTHHVGSLADHLADDRELVRYHLCTALVVVGCASPEALAAAEDALRERLGDENPYVRGRGAEALAVLAESNAGVEPRPDVDAEDGELPGFLTDRLCFLRARVDGGQSGSTPDGLGTVESVRAGTDDVVEEMRSTGDGECPNCGLELPESGPPTCPRCGAPR